MADMTAIAGMVASFKAVKDIVEAMVTLRDTEMIRGKVFELQSKMLEAQSFAFAAHDERAFLIQRIGELEKEIANLETWATEKQRYELYELAPGIVAYAIKESMRDSEPFHYLCANCYNAGKKSYLQQHIRSPHGDRYKCNVCGEVLTIRKAVVDQPTVANSAPRRTQNWLDW